MDQRITYINPMIQQFYEIEPLHHPLQELVVILHGYGASGDNIIGIASFWKDLFPHTLFVAPNAPTAWTTMYGFEWFPLPDLTENTLKAGCEKAVPIVHKMVKQLQEKYQIGWEKTTLVGFSQGAMLALATALKKTHTCGKVLSYAGGLFIEPSQIKAKPQDLEIMLVHGTDDTVVPVQASIQTKKTLEEKKFHPHLHLILGLDHSIDEKGLTHGKKFLKDKP